MRLTPVGEQLRDQVEPVYEQLHHVLEQTREAAVGITGTLRIGAYSAALFGPHLSEIIEVFEADIRSAG